MTMDSEIADIGNELVRVAEEDAEFSAQRGLVDELFPYIYRASKRMSTRAISRWLKEAKNIKLSAATIAKALRESDRYWIAFFDEVEAAADIVARAHGWDSGIDLIKDSNAYLGETSQTPVVSGENGYWEYQGAKSIVESVWFNGLDDVGREECLAVVEAARRQEEAEEKNNEPTTE